MFELVFVINIMHRNIYWKRRPNYHEIRVGSGDLSVNHVVLAKKIDVT